LTALLSITDLVVRYGHAQAVSGASIEISPGDLRVILGANGAGKSTIIKTILGLLRPSSGRIMFDGGRDLGRMRPHDIHRLGIAWVPEGRQLWAALTVEENLQMGAFLQKDRSRITRRMEDMYLRFPRLKERRHQAAGSLSGGEQQMVAIVRALMSEPRLLLMDEPSLGLAPLVVRDLFALVLELNREGLTVLMVEQNAKMSLEIANFAYLLEVGAVAAAGPAETLMASETIRDVFLGGHVTRPTISG
jgi:branched-chain amino acid transport system ATP-binding protein